MIAVKEREKRPGPMQAFGRSLGVAWGVGGIAAVLAYAAFGLGRYAFEAASAGLGPAEWGLMLLNAGFMAWAEGYRGFHLRFAPRVAARALNLYRDPTPGRLWLAPLFCVGYFGASPRLRSTVWVGSGLIVLAVLLFNQVAQPWRGILDAGVMVGLLFGTVSLLAATWTTFNERREIVSAEVPPGMCEGAGL